MCDICNKSRCPMGCPGHLQEEMPLFPLARCVLCGKVVTAGDLIHRHNGFPYCRACLLQGEAETLMRICEMLPRDFFGKLGFDSLQEGGTL